MAQINNTHLNLKYMSHEELSIARGHAELRVHNALEDVEKLSGEMALRETAEFPPVEQLVIPELEQSKQMRY